MIASLQNLLENALTRRAALLDEQHRSALRLFNGFSEGLPALTIDLYAQTLLIHNLSRQPEELTETIQQAQQYYQSSLPWLICVVLKVRHAPGHNEKCGQVLFGESPADRVLENGVWYALDLLFQQDASLYLDTRNLRLWAKENLAGKSLLNTFAYTGSLGVAALAGGARKVVQLDRNLSYLKQAERSCQLNGFPGESQLLLAGDFWQNISRMKQKGELFDCVMLDPPFFATSREGTVDLSRESTRLVNKLRPLVNHQSWLVAVNNALFLSGKDYLSGLEKLCADGYLQIEELIPVPQDVSGYSTSQITWPTDPAPFNHPTKIVVLRVTRKAL